MALYDLIKSIYPDSSDDAINDQINQLKQGASTGLSTAINSLPFGSTLLNAVKGAKNLAGSAPVQEALRGATGQPMGGGLIPPAGNPVSGAAQGALAGLGEQAINAADPMRPPSYAPQSESDLPTDEGEAETPPISPNTPPVAPIEQNTQESGSKSPSTASDTSAAPQAPVEPPTSSDEAQRQALLAQQKKQHDLGILPVALAGAGDAISNAASAFGAKGTSGTQEKVANELNEGQAKQKTQLDENLKNDPSSDISRHYQQVTAMMMGKPANDPSVTNKSANQIASTLPQVEKFMQKEISLKAIQAQKELNVGLRTDQQQDKLEQNAKMMVAQLRGDKSLARAEEQRDAASVAYNRLKEVQASGKGLNPIDYVDILGQIYKARTGTAPGEQVLKDIRQSTAQGSFDKAYTYVTGQQAPATSQGITQSLMSMAQSMGKQADDFHAGYMKSHLIKPTSLSDDRWEPIVKTGRGMSFAEATGTQPGAAPQDTVQTLKDGRKFVSHNGTWYEVK